jgi:hypothetical protein
VSAACSKRGRFSRRLGMASILLGKEVGKLPVSNGCYITNRVYIPRNYGGWVSRFACWNANEYTVTM